MIEPQKILQMGRRRELSNPGQTCEHVCQTRSSSVGGVVQIQTNPSFKRQDHYQESAHLFNRGPNDRFEKEIMCHLDAAYNLALWLLHNTQDAEDATQSALYKAFRAFGRMRSNDAKPWLLAIVRNECMDMLHSRTVRNRSESSSDENWEAIESTAISPERAALQSLDSQTVIQAIEQLPPEFREVVLLREIEEMSYLEIAQVIEKPVGTVMSRLARARGRLQVILSSGGAL
jgi:RNA polymerase sigma-70 factor (ECF subfamily)